MIRPQKQKACHCGCSRHANADIATMRGCFLRLLGLLPGVRHASVEAIGGIRQLGRWDGWASGLQAVDYYIVISASVHLPSCQNEDNAFVCFRPSWCPAVCHSHWNTLLLHLGPTVRWGKVVNGPLAATASKRARNLMPSGRVGADYESPVHYKAFVVAPGEFDLDEFRVQLLF